MRKIFFFLTLFMSVAVAQAVPTFSINPSHIDFGEVSIKGTDHVEGELPFSVTYSGLLESCGIAFEDVDAEMPAEGAAFWIEGTNTDGWIYGGDAWNDPEGDNLTLHYYADKAGSYTGKIAFYTYTDADWTVESARQYLTMELTVTDEAIVVKVTDFERINSTSDLHEGDVVVFLSEASAAVGGPLEGTYLPAITENLTVDASTGKAKVPETAQQFTMSKYSGNWQFTTTDTGKRMNLDITGKGAFTFADPKAGEILAGWGISISGGAATVSKPDGTFPVEFNENRFKPYKSPQGSTWCLYKKVGDPEEIESKLTIPSGINFGNLEQDDTWELQVSFLTEHIDGEILWDIVGTDKSLFSLDASDVANGTLVITYLGTADKTGSVNAQLYALFENTKLDMQEEYFDININLLPATVKLTKIEFSASTPTTIDQGQSIDLSSFVVLTPDNAEDKSLNWATDHDYQGTITNAGVLTAKHVTGKIVVTVSSVRVPSVKATHELTITVPTITDFTLSDSEVTLHVGETKTISIVSFVPEYATATPTYASHNTAVATVSKGVITAKSLGEADITVTVGGVEKKCHVTVEPVTVNSIAFNVTSADISLGAVMVLNPIVDPAQAVDEYTITWSSDNETVVSVDANGEITALAEGEATITASIAGLDAYITFTVVAPKTFAKVLDPADLADKDTIILATIKDGVGVVAGPRDDKKLTIAKEAVSVTETEAYADDAIRFVLTAVSGGFELTPLGATKPIAVTKTGNDITNKTASNCPVWKFVADGENGVYVQNTGNENAYFKYHQGNAAIKPYKVNTAGAVYVYVYVRHWIDPTITGVDALEANEPARKLFRDGQIIIIRNGVEYSVDGKRR